ncbi:hypothetical protein [Pseudomonas sp. 910_21]|uniref:hypothetical protein n=1 Tax=Pseudomonas sp. 910_21 TaxID=2604460 RepID=UPI004062B654
MPDGKGGQEPRFTCNLFLQTRSNALDVLQDLATTFRGMSYWAAGSVMAIADIPEDPVYIPQPTGSTLGGVLWAHYTVNLNPSKAYAAHIPWDRGCGFVSQLGSSTVFRGAVHEGCYGQQGSIVHCMWNSPETTYDGVHSTTPQGFMSLLSDRMPSCSYIDTAEYPYPFNPQL